MDKRPNTNSRIIISCDDYSEYNTTVAELLEKYNLKAIFFIECQFVKALDQIAKLFDRGFEIGSHTITHPQDLKKLPDDELWGEIHGSRDVIEGAIGEKIDWFAYPRGRYNERVIKVVKDSGYKYARTTNLFSKGDYELGGYHCFQRKEYTKDWIIEILDAIMQGKTNHIWLHVKEIDDRNEWELLEKLFKFIHENIRI